MHGISPRTWLFVISLGVLTLNLGGFSVLFNLYLVALGYDAAFVGIVLAAQPLGLALVSVPLGLISDRFGRIAVLAVCELILGLATVGQALFPDPAPLYALGFATGIGVAGFEIVYPIFLTENSTPRERTQVFSLAAAVTFLGTSAGQVIGAFLPNAVDLISHRLGTELDLLSRYQWSLVALGVLAVLATAALVPIREAPRERHAPPLRDILTGLKGRSGQIVLLSTILGVTIGMTNPFQNLLFVDHLGVSREFYGLVTSTVILANVAGPLLSTRTRRRWGDRWPWIIGRSVMGIILVIMALSPNAYLTAGMVWLRGFLVTLITPIMNVFQMEMIDPKIRSAITGVNIICFYLGITTGTAAAGWLIATYGYPAPFLVAAALHVLLFVVPWYYFIRHRDPATST